MGTMLALGVAPAIVRAESLMRVFVRKDDESGLFTPTLVNQGYLDDYEEGWLPNNSGVYTRIGDVVTINATIPVRSSYMMGYSEFNKLYPVK